HAWLRPAGPVRRTHRGGHCREGGRVGPPHRWNQVNAASSRGKWLLGTVALCDAARARNSRTSALLAQIEHFLGKAFNPIAGQCDAVRLRPDPDADTL